MSPEKQRIAIAEAAGWRWYRIPQHPSQGERHYRCLFHPATHEYEGQSEKWLVRADGSERVCNMEYMAREGHVPDYLNDLNACHEFEKTLDVNELSRYADELEKICVPVHICPLTHFQAVVMATAAQRCEAFLKAKNLWKP